MTLYSIPIREHCIHASQLISLIFMKQYNFAAIFKNLFLAFTVAQIFCFLSFSFKLIQQYYNSFELIRTRLYITSFPIDHISMTMNTFRIYLLISIFLRVSFQSYTMCTVRTIFDHQFVAMRKNIISTCWFSKSHSFI